MFKTNEDLFPQCDHINGFSSNDGTDCWQSQKSFRSQEKIHINSKGLPILPSKKWRLWKWASKISQRNSYLVMCINKSFSKNSKKPAGLISSTFTFSVVQFRLDPSKIWSPRHRNIFRREKQTLTHFEGVAELQNFSSQENHPKGSQSGRATSSNTNTTE